jgi:polysaccharide export outer membrane protein
MKYKSSVDKCLFCLQSIFPSLIIIFVFLSACVTHRDVEYLQESLEKNKSYKELPAEDYKLKPKDELYIQISSLDDPSAKIFSTTGNQQFINIGAIQPYGASLISYVVDKEGFILLPVIGLINVKDKTIEQVSLLITNSLNKILSHPMVSVKLVNRYITILGEVQRPGQYTYSLDKVTVFEALGLAGDITDYGDRRGIILIRNENGTIHRISMDLTQSDFLASNYLYLNPNDIVYVKPLRKKFWAMRQFPYDVLLSAITAAILFYSVTK